MINAQLFHSQMNSFQNQLTHLKNHSANELNKGLRGDVAEQYKFLMSASEHLLSWSVSFNKPQTVSSSEKFLFGMYRELSSMNAVYASGVDDRIKGRGNYDLASLTNLLLQDLTQCVQ